MSLFSKARQLSLIASNPHLITCKPKYLFILSHMRSRSSVLSHVLGSNPGVCGYSELHNAYASRMDLLKMRAELYRDVRCRLGDKYLLDKLLHNHCRVSDEVLAAAKPKVIFLLREPESTLRSIINMGHRTGEEWYKDSSKVLQYYCARLADLEKYARRLGSGYFYMDAEEIVGDTDRLLARLTNWLELPAPLEKSYASFRNTGKRHYGDSSNNIKSGVIRPTPPHTGVKVPPHVMQMAETAYHRCRRRLIKNSGAQQRVRRTA